MVVKSDDGRRNIERGRQDVADTSSAIAEKLAILERRVQETVDAAKHKVDFHYQVKQRPWLMVGASLLVGYALGRGRGRSSTTTEMSRVSSPLVQLPENHLAGFKGAALAAITSTLWAMAKQVLLPAVRQVDDAIGKAGARLNEDSKANGAKARASEAAPAPVCRFAETR
jgi:hypothetical protein